MEKFERLLWTTIFPYTWDRDTQWNYCFHSTNIIELLEQHLVANVPPQNSFQNRPTMLPKQDPPNTDVELEEEDLGMIIEKLKPGARAQVKFTMRCCQICLL